jgi:hypothetical protein
MHRLVELEHIRIDESLTVVPNLGLADVQSLHSEVRLDSDDVRFSKWVRLEDIDNV